MKQDNLVSRIKNKLRDTHSPQSVAGSVKQQDDDEPAEESALVKHFRRLIRVDCPDMYFSPLLALADITDELKCE